MSRKLFVGGLAWATDQARLQTAFEPYGAIEQAVVITDRETGQSRGFGFVTYVEESSAQAALQAMNGKELDGRRLRVDSAEEKPRAGSGGGGGRGPGGYSGGGNRGGTGGGISHRGNSGGGGGPRGGGYGGTFSGPPPDRGFPPMEGTGKDDRRRDDRWSDRGKKDEDGEEDEWGRRGGGARGARGGRDGADS